MNDLISRQAAIDIERNATVDTNPSHFEAHQKFTQFMDDAEISSFGRWQWSNGFNTALTAVGIDLKKLPPEQPEQRWIPCSEQLPDVAQRVLLSGHGQVMVGMLHSFGKYSLEPTGISYVYPKDDIEAWMPLPAPYREEGECE